MEDVYEIEGHTFLCNDDFLRSLDDEVATLIELAFSVADALFQIFVVQGAILREHHDWQSTKSDKVLSLVSRSDFLSVFRAVCEARRAHESNGDLNLDEVVQVTDSRHHWIDLLL